MTEHDHDLLIARLRDADPTAGRALPAPNPAAVRRRRARRSSRRLTGAALGAAAAVALAVSLAPSGGSRLDRVVERAAAASAPPAGRIVAIESRVDASWTRRDGPGGLWEEKTTWVRFSAGGEVLGVRTLTTDASPGRPGLENVTERVGGGWRSRQFDPATRKVRTFPRTREIPGVEFQAHQLLAAAKQGDARVRLDGEEMVGGRRAHRLVIVAWDGLPPPIEGVEGRHELLIDAETYVPIAERLVETSRSVTYRLTEHVIGHTELSDTAENRKLLTLRGGAR